MLRRARLATLALFGAFFGAGVFGSPAPKLRAAVVVVRPLSSCPSADRAWGGTLAKHVVRFLAEGGVKADLADDRMLEETLRERRLAYLVMPLTPTAAQLGAVKRYLARGGKLCVFHSSSIELGRMMGVRPLPEKTVEGGYGGFTFTQGPAGTPRAIVQANRSIRPAAPAKGGTRVIATWHAASGRATPDAAVLASSGGWWVTQAFPSGGDERAKGLFVLALAGAAVPGSWHAARHYAALRARDQAAMAYARRQVPRPGEIHAVWDHAGEGLYPGDWPRTMRLLSSCGITDLFVNVAGAGFAHYPTSFLPGSALLARQGDQLRQALAAARGTGIRVHAWILCFTAARGTAGEIARCRARGWVLRDRRGGWTEYLNPSVPALRTRLLSAAEDLVRRYPVAGVHLDFVRWYEGGAVPAGGAKAVTDFVATARQRVKAARPAAWLTAAVLAGYPACVRSVGQDWGAWLDRGLVDYAVPMNYAGTRAACAAFLARQAPTPARARRIISGIGVTANESRLDAAHVIDQVLAARQRGCAGVALFDLDYTLGAEILPYLRAGLFGGR